MNWIQKLVDDAKKKSAVAASNRTGQALSKYASILEKLPKEWSIFDLMRSHGCTYDQAKSIVKHMRKHGLIYAARDIKLYARSKPDAKPRVEVSKGELEAKYLERWQSWADDLPMDCDLTNKQMQDLWDVGYDSAKYRVARLVELKLLEGAEWGKYRRVK